MSATAERSQPSAPRSVAATQLLRQNPVRSLVCAGLVLVSIPLSVGLVGLLLFAGVVYHLVQSYFESAFRTKARGSFLAPLLIISLALGAVLVAGGWIAFTDIFAQGYILSSKRVVFALLTLPIPYVICAWVLAPVVYLIVLLIDIDAPKSLRHLIPLALRVASEVPIVHRVVAVLASGAVLIGPAAAAAYIAEGSHNKISSGALTGLLMVPLFIPVASALLVSSYSRVRHDLDSYQGHLPNFPPGLALLTLVTLALSGLAATLGFEQAGSILLLALAWLAIVAALFSFLSAHRIRCLDPMKEGASPGRRALEGVLQRSESKNLFVAGGLRFPIPARAVADHIDDGAPLTLVGDFAATTHALFRERSEQTWPNGGRLYPKSLDALIRGRVRVATWVSYFALGAAGLLSVEVLSNVF